MSLSGVRPMLFDVDPAAEKSSWPRTVLFFLPGAPAAAGGGPLGELGPGTAPIIAVPGDAAAA